MGEHRRNPVAEAARNGSIPPKGGNVQINSDDLWRYGCRICGHTHFDPDFQMFDVPLVLRYATGGGDVLQAQKWACRSCGHLQVVPEMKKLPPISQGEVVESMPEGDLKPKPTMIEVVRGHAF